MPAAARVKSNRNKKCQKSVEFVFDLLKIKYGSVLVLVCVFSSPSLSLCFEAAVHFVLPHAPTCFIPFPSAMHSYSGFKLHNLLLFRPGWNCINYNNIYT